VACVPWVWCGITKHAGGCVASGRVLPRNVVHVRSARRVNRTPFPVYTTWSWRQGTPSSGLCPIGVLTRIDPQCSPHCGVAERTGMLRIKSFTLPPPTWYIHPQKITKEKIPAIHVSVVCTCNPFYLSADCLVHKYRMYKC
jgi:hypothetical protein